MELPQTQNHAPVTVAIVASAVAGILIAYAKKYGVDLAGQELNIITVVTAIGYLVKGKVQA